MAEGIWEPYYWLQNEKGKEKGKEKGEMTVEKKRHRCMVESKEMWERKKAFAVKELMKKGYQKIIVVGQGAFSVVFRVWDDKQKCFWACKISETSEMAVKEAEMLQRIRHPLFPKYKTSWESHGYFFLLMEYVCGSNIRELCKRRKQFTQRQAVCISLELARGLLFLHEWEEPIVFRDVKPENVMIRQDGSIKLVDMGCATSLNVKQYMAGSKGYAAPEQFDEMPNAGFASDVYALGKLLFFMITGLESNDCLPEWRHVGRTKRIAPGLLQLIQRATRQECQERIPDMRVFIEYLVICERKHSVKWIWEGIKNIFFEKEIVDFYYIQNIRRGIDI